jgi:hypothetical protein
MKIVKVEPNRKPVVTDIENTLKSLQKVVGGYIEHVSLPPFSSGFALICNEEGKLIGLPPNRCMGNDVVMGTFFITKGNEEGEFVSLTNGDLKFIKENYLTDLELEGINEK